MNANANGLQQQHTFGNISLGGAAGSSVAETEASKYKELVNIQGTGGATSARTTGALQQMKAQQQYGQNQTGTFGTNQLNRQGQRDPNAQAWRDSRGVTMAVDKNVPVMNTKITITRPGRVYTMP